MPILSVELIPKATWYQNVRSMFSQDEWDILRKSVYANAGYKCEICSGIGTNQGYRHDVECHERWEFNETDKIQTLVGFIALCPLCHKCKHPGLAQINGEMKLVVNQLIKVNQITTFQANQLINKAFHQWHIRNKINWKIDVTFAESSLDYLNNTDS